MKLEHKNILVTKVPLPPKLMLVKKMADKVGKECTLLRRKSPSGDLSEPLLKVAHGNNHILFQEGPGSIVVGYVLVTFNDIKNILTSMERSQRDSLLSNLRESLQTHPTYGYRIVPYEIKDISEIEYISIEKEIYLEDVNPSSINMFLDVCQGLVTMGKRAHRAFRPDMESEITAGSPDTSGNPFDGMYQ